MRPQRGNGTEIREADARRMLGFVTELSSLDHRDEFRSGVLPGLRGLVPCEIAAYNEIEFGAADMLALTDPDGVVPPGGEETLARLAHQNPLIEMYQRTRDGRPYKWSDFMTRRELHGTQLYAELYRRLGIEHQMAFALPSPATQVIGLTVNREARDFSERDRKVLNLIRAPMIQAYRTVERYEELATRMRSMDRGLERGGTGVIVLERGGERADFVSDGARAALGFGDGGPLPEPLAEWLRQARAGRPTPVAPAVVEGPRGDRAVVHHLPGRKAGDPDALLVQPHAGELLSVSDLRAAGLTARQAEVMRLVALGMSNDEIAAELVVSPRTVKKHIQNIYERLGARSRTQAILAAWCVAKGGAPA